MTFHSLVSFLRNLVRNEDGPTAVEYAVMLALILLAVISSVALLGQDANGTFNKANTEFNKYGMGP